MRDCNPKSCFFVKNENFKEMEKTINKASKLNKTEYIKLSAENQMISKENTSKFYNRKLNKIFNKIN